ncbi:MAG: ATP-dependent DNA helicase RecG [Arenicella sp.]|jgi:ATP-dependent DNA helicase RecG
MTIEKIIQLKESENKVEFKEAKGGSFSYNGRSKLAPKDRRRCILGYVTAFANEGGGYLIFGIEEGKPNIVVGTSQNENRIRELEADIYRDTGIRVSASELYDTDKKRVLVLDIPSRPIGKVYKFEDVSLMRIGEELKPMSDEQYLKIIQEQEPDFSQKICEGVSIDGLDDDAVQNMKKAYARKQDNPQFLTLSKEQVLSDLDLIRDDKVTNAAVILLGKKEVIKAHIPQTCVQLEYRNDDSKIPFDQRHTFSGAFFLEADRLWNTINLRNGKIPIQEGPFIFDIPYFNQEVIREAINNAVAHRDYRLTGEIVIKQYPSELTITNPGRFPVGVTIDNLLTTPSTPRNRLLTDILQKTGIVERSGQGVDKIYFQTLKEGKTEPDYTKSDDFAVELTLSAVIEDKAFALFIESVQSELSEGEKLSVQEIIHLNEFRKGNRDFKVSKEIIDKLLGKNLIEKKGKTRGTYYLLSRQYYEFTDKKGKYSMNNIDHTQASILILGHLKEFETAKMNDFIDLFNGTLTRMQVRTIVDKLLESKELSKSGKGKATYYTIGENFLKGMEVFSRALEIGMQKLKEDGEIE